MDDLGGALAGWPVDKVSACVTNGMAVVATGGDPLWVTRLASVTKLLSALAVLIAVEEETVDLDEPAGGATIRHLLSHAAGYDFDTGRMAAGVGERRVYSNVGFEVLADHVAQRAGMPFAEYARMAVVEPLGMTRTIVDGSAAHGMKSCVADMARFAQEIQIPMLISQETLAEATTVQYPDLAGVLPGVARFDPNPWGLGFEIKGDKWPHWSGRDTSSNTYGHFGGAGTFLWVDPDADMAVVVLTDREFGAWSMDVWPAFSDQMLRRYGR